MGASYLMLCAFFVPQTTSIIKSNILRFFAPIIQRANLALINPEPERDEGDVEE